MGSDSKIHPKLFEGILRYNHETINSPNLKLPISKSNMNKISHWSNMFRNTFGQMENKVSWY